jgi:CBS domain containing-hemolysin-like protein
MQNFYLTLLAFVFVLMNAFFVAAEFAIVKLRHTKAEELAGKAGARGRILYKVHSHLDEYLSACQLGLRSHRWVWAGSANRHSRS